MNCRNVGLCGMFEDCPFEDQCENIANRLLEEADSPWFCIEHPDNQIMNFLEELDPTHEVLHT